MKKRKPNQESYIPRWGIWAIGVFIFVILVTLHFLTSASKSSQQPSRSTQDTQPQLDQVQQHEAMTAYKIVATEQRFPHWKKFQIRIPNPVSREEIESLTRKIASVNMERSEFILCVWWLAEQSIENDACWATSRLEKNQVSVSFVGQSQDNKLKLVKGKPMSEPGEIGLWYMESGELSRYVQLIIKDETKVELRTYFGDGSNGREEREIIDRNPLRIRWLGDWDEDETFLQINSDSAVLGDKGGVFATLKKIR